MASSGMLGCLSCKNLLHQGVVSRSPILVTLMKEALSSTETSVITGVTGRNILEDAILYVTDGCKFVGMKTEGRKPLGRSRIKWENIFFCIIRLYCLLATK
jgi:hypothetical protein